MKRILVWFFLVFCWGSSIWLGSRILEQQDMLSLRLEGDGAGITGAGLEKMLEKYYAAAYEEAGLITAKAAATGRDAEVSVILMAGNSRLVTGSRLLDGSFGLGDPGECMISRAAALELFGGAASAGLSVLADGREWYVRGVFDADRPIILLPAEKDVLLTNLEFQIDGSRDNQAEAEQACYQYGVTGRQKIIDYSFFAAVARLLMWLPFVMLLCLLKRTGRRLSAAAKGNILYYGLELLFWAGILFAVFQAVRFPSGFIPAKWSDFHFWSVKWEEAVKAFDILYTSPLLKDRMLSGRLAGCGLLSAAVLPFWATKKGAKLLL